MKKYVVYGNTGAIDSIEAKDGFTIDEYLEECHTNGCYYENESELYIQSVEE